MVNWKSLSRISASWSWVRYAKLFRFTLPSARLLTPNFSLPSSETTKIILNFQFTWNYSLPCQILVRFQSWEISVYLEFQFTGTLSDFGEVSMSWEISVYLQLQFTLSDFRLPGISVYLVRFCVISCLGKFRFTLKLWVLKNFSLPCNYEFTLKNFSSLWFFCIMNC